MRTEIRSFIVDRLELIDTMETPVARQKAYGGILLTLQDLVEDIKLDLGEQTALIEIENNKRNKQYGN